MNAIKHGLSRVNSARAADPQTCRVALLEVEHQARVAFHRLALELSEQPEAPEFLDWDVRMSRISAAISSLTKLERYRTPRFRAWVKSIADEQQTPTGIRR